MLVCAHSLWSERPCTRRKAFRWASCSCPCTSTECTRPTGTSIGRSVTFVSTGVSLTRCRDFRSIHLADPSPLVVPSDPDSTTRKSTHNAEMKQIVIEHIVSHRYAYPEIPETEFTADRLEATYEQSFNSWKAKFLGKKPSGPHKRAKTSMGLREIQKLLEVVGTGRDGSDGQASGSQMALDAGDSVRTIG